MKAALLHEDEGLRTFAVVLSEGDEGLVVAYFDWTTKTYRNIPIEEQVEVLSLVGDVSVEDGKRKIHAHVVVAVRTMRRHTAATWSKAMCARRSRLCSPRHRATSAAATIPFQVSA